MVNENKEVNQAQTTNPVDDRDKDRISSDEFEALEKTENKKSFLKRIFGSEEKKEEDVQNEDDILKEKTSAKSFSQLLDAFYNLNKRFDNILLQIEKNSGKLELMEEAKRTSDEKISNLSNQTGELRSLIVSRERAFEKNDAEFDELKKEFRKFDTDSLNLKFKSMNSNLENLNKWIKYYDKSFNEKVSVLPRIEEDILELKKFSSQIAGIDKLKENIDIVKTTKEYVDDKLKKIESLYGSLQIKLSDVDKFINNFSNISETVKRLEKEMDRISVLSNVYVDKNEVAKIQKDIIKLKDYINPSHKTFKLGLSEIDSYVNNEFKKTLDPQTQEKIEKMIPWILDLQKKGKSLTEIKNIAIKDGWPEELFELALEVM
jgi:uncharacterized protein YoxC